MKQQSYNLYCQQIYRLYQQVQWLKYWNNLQQNHPTQTPSSVPRSLTENRNRDEGKLDLGLFFGFLRRIAPLFAEKKREIAQIQLFWNRLSILGQAPNCCSVSVLTLSNIA